jgi:hypothetical protein
MITLNGVTLAHVQTVYDGPEGDLWELIMGQQIHLGGFASSMDLDLCKSLGAELAFVRDLAHAGRIAQGRFVAHDAQ